MIKFIKNGNIFNSKCTTLVNPVNCVGVMGKGLALEFKKRYPKMFEYYYILYLKNKLIIGNVQIYRGEKNILLFPTKNHWKDKSFLSNIKCGLRSFIDLYDVLVFNSIAFPALGCGLGELNWKDVKELFMKYLDNFSDLYIEIYEPLEK